MAEGREFAEAVRLARQGASDERIEALTGLSLLDIIAVRVAASEPLRSAPRRASEEASSRQGR